MKDEVYIQIFFLHLPLNKIHQSMVTSSSLKSLLLTKGSSNQKKVLNSQWNGRIHAYEMPSFVFSCTVLPSSVVSLFNFKSIHFNCLINTVFYVIIFLSQLPQILVKREIF